MSIAAVQNAILNAFQKDSVCDAEFSTPIQGTVSSSGETVTGVGTSFTTELKKGDYIGSITKGYRKVREIISDTQLTVTSAFESNLNNETIKKTEIKKGLPKNLNIIEVGKTLRVVFASADEKDREVPDVNVQVAYGFLIVIVFYEPDEDEAESRKSFYDKIIHDVVDKDPTFGGVTMGIVDTRTVKFAEHPEVDGLYYIIATLIVETQETTGNR